MCNGRLFCAILSQVLFGPQVPVDVCSHCLHGVRCCSHKAGGGRHQGCLALLYLRMLALPASGSLELMMSSSKEDKRKNLFFFLFMIHTAKDLNRLLNWETEKEGKGFLHLLHTILCLTKLFTIH